MCEEHQPLDRFHRRGFLKSVGCQNIAAMSFVPTGALIGIAHADALTKAQRDKLSPDDILALMKKGNKRFYTGKRENHKFPGAAARQRRGSISRGRAVDVTSTRALRPETILICASVMFSTAAWKCGNADVLRQHGVCLQARGRQSGSGDGPHRRRHQGRNRQRRARQSPAFWRKSNPPWRPTKYGGERTSKNYAFVDAVARKNVEFTIANIARIARC